MAVEKIQSLKFRWGQGASEGNTMQKDLIKAIIFDMDGVLVDSEPIHEKVEIETLEEFGMAVPKAEWDGFRGKKIEDIFYYAIGKYGTGKEDIEEMIERKIEKYLSEALKSMELIAGAREFLGNLKSQAGLRLALTTSGRKVQQDKILEKFGLRNYFEIMVTADEINRGKPDPEPYLVTVGKLGEDSGRCLVIEDSDNGILSAKGAGCVACGITTTFNSRKLKTAGADIIVDSFSELEKMLEI
jgi:beta-phosphoglucomutase